MLSTVRSALEPAGIALLPTVRAPDARLQVALHDESFVGRDDAATVLSTPPGPAA